jgi:eukaryotic-like serine/threonine-protein kinase
MKRIQTLGGLAVFDGPRPLGGNAQQPRRLALLAVLARAGERGVNRDRLATLLWGDVEPDRARRSLNQALYAIRQDLGSEDSILGTRDLRLNPELVEVDVLAFETANASGALEEAARIYGGPFLGDFHLAGVRDFALWAEEQRDRLAAEYRGVLEAAAVAAVQRGDTAGAVLWWRRLAAVDPADAQAAQGLMRALAMAGDAPGALRHGEIFNTLRSEELELPPDPEIEALVERIRRGDLAPRPAVRTASVVPLTPASLASPAEETFLELPSAGTPAPQRVKSRSAWLTLALAALALAALGGALLRWRAAPASALRPSVIVVAPFDVFDSGLQLWHEGLVDLLSRSLDGAGPLSTVPPSIVMRRWSGRADVPSAAALGHRTGAGLALYGSLLLAGRDSVQVRATLLDVANGRSLDEWEVTDAADRMDRLVDSLTVRLLAGLGRSRPIGAVSLPGFRATSLSVLKAFLQGEQHFRRSEWDSALAYYKRAIDLDGTFAPALRRASSTLAWRDRAHSPEVLEYAARAGANNHGWPTRDSMLIAGESEFFSLMGSSMVEGVDSTLPSRVRHLFATAEHAVDLYPDDPDAWQDLGEAYTHFGAYVRASYEEQLGAFDRAIALDSSYSPGYLHPIEISSAFGADAMRRYLRPYLALTRGEPGAESARLLEHLIDSTQGVTDPAALFRGFSDQSTMIAAFALGRLADSAERMVDLARYVASERSKPGMPGMADMMEHANMAARQLARALVSRGHLHAGLEVLPRQELGVSRTFVEAALLGAVPAEQAAAVFRERTQEPFTPSFTARFPWWAAQRDTAFLRRANAWSDSVARGAQDPDIRVASSYVAAAALAYHALARRDTATAIERLTGLPDGGCPTCYLDQLTLAELLSERRRDREAWQILKADGASGTVIPLPGEVLWALLQGRVAERLGQRDRAVRSYSWVADMWRNADPELRGYVREAQNGRARLLGERR